MFSNSLLQLRAEDFVGIKIEQPVVGSGLFADALLESVSLPCMLNHLGTRPTGDRTSARAASIFRSM